MATVPSPADSSADVAPEIRAFERELCDRLAPADHEHWFRDRTTVRLDGAEFVVGVGSPFLLNWMQNEFRASVREAAVAVLGPPGTSRFEVDPSLATITVPVDSSVAAKSSAGTSTKGSGKARNPDAKRTRRFRDLAEFVEGDSNRLALAAATHVGVDPLAGTGPLLLIGGVGTGKTHLLEGIHRRVRREHPQLTVTSINAEAFGNYFVQALKEYTLPAFRNRFRNVDVLLVDDVDFFDGKKATQEEFLNTVKQLECDGRRVVVAAGRHPRLMKRLPEELATRLAGGIVCRLENPDPVTRRRILERRIVRVGLRADDAVLDDVTRRFSGGVRELEGAVACLAAWQEMTNQRVTRSVARNVLAELARDCTRVVRMSDVERVVCEFFGVEPEDLRSAKRQRSISRPRMVAMFLARKLMGASYSEIGRHFSRNHTTVLNAERKVAEWIGTDESVPVSAGRWSVDEVVNTLERELVG